MTYTPRGNVKNILDGMATQSPDLEWTPEELAAFAGIDKYAVSSTLRCAVNHGAVFTLKKGREFVYSLTPYPEDATDEGAGTAEPAEFKAALWSDGDLVIYGAQENTDGSVTLNREQLAEIKRLVSWSQAQ